MKKKTFQATPTIQGLGGSFQNPASMPVFHYGSLPRPGFNLSSGLSSIPDTIFHKGWLPIAAKINFKKKKISRKSVLEKKIE